MDAIKPNKDSEGSKPKQSAQDPRKSLLGCLFLIFILFVIFGLQPLRVYLSKKNANLIEPRFIESYNASHNSDLALILKVIYLVGVSEGSLGEKDFYFKEDVNKFGEWKARSWKNLGAIRVRIKLSKDCIIYNEVIPDYLFDYNLPIELQYDRSLKKLHPFLPKPADQRIDVIVKEIEEFNSLSIYPKGTELDLVYNVCYGRNDGKEYFEAFLRNVLSHETSTEERIGKKIEVKKLRIEGRG